MSFSLYVYLREYHEDLERAWVARLETLGLKCELPEDFSLPTAYRLSDDIVCTVGPPLADTPWKPLPTNLGLDPSAPLDYDLEKGRSSRDTNVQAVMRAATRAFHFYSSAGRSNVDLLLQCYGAAALADVGRGVIVDEDGTMAYGWAAYAVAHKNSFSVFEIPEPQPAPAPRRSFWRRLFGPRPRTMSSD
jgi:hypothetical protein